MENRGFLYGDGFFETVLIKDGKFCLKDLHFNRIRESFKLLMLENSTSALEQLEGLNFSDSNPFQRLRINFYRSGTGKYLPNSNQFEWSYSLESIDSFKFCDPNPLKAIIYSQNKKSDSPISSIKSLNCQIYVLAAIEAQKHNAQESIILNDRNEIIEFSTGNIFYIKNKVIFTPPQSGQIKGVAQEFFKKICIELGIHIEEKVTKTTDLMEADEIFRTNTITGINPIYLYENQVFKKTLELQKHYLKLHS